MVMHKMKQVSSALEIICHQYITIKQLNHSEHNACSVDLQEQRLKFLKQQDQRQQQQAAEQEKLKRLKEIAENQEAKLKKVRALKGHVEQKRLSNGKLGELLEVFWITGL